MPPLSQSCPDTDFERLIRENRAQLHGFVLSLVANNSDAEDLLQQICLILWEKRQQFEPDSNFLAWARKICRYQALNHWRKEKARPAEQQFDERLVNMIHERSEEREREFIRHRRALQNCLTKLHDRHREVIESFYFDEKSVTEIAEQNGMKPNAVSQLLFRARARLIACVQSQSAGLGEDCNEIT